jgi:hypothetical protein
VELVLSSFHCTGIHRIVNYLLLNASLYASVTGEYMQHCIQDGENVRFEVFAAVTMKNGVFWYVTLCGSCKNRRFGGT